MDIAIVGGGAAGFFAAIAAKENYPQATVVIFEKSQQILAKVKISGGGRCNITNACSSIQQLAAAYPRGGNALKRAFRTFDNKDAMRWFEARQVPLVVQEDNCVFPRSQDSQSVIDCFVQQAEKLHIKVELERGIKSVTQVGDRLQLGFCGSKFAPRTFDKVIVATGGSPKRAGLA